MEGMAGVVHLQQVMRGMPEYERSCRLMTAETNAAVAGARSAGATRIVVNDSHGDMRNFLLDELDEGVEIISGADKPYPMRAGLDRQAAGSLHPVEACRRIEAGAYRAYAEQAGRPLYQPKGPFVLEIDWMNASMADLCIELPEVERAGGRTVRYRTADFQTCYRMLLALLVMATPAAYQYPRP